VVRVPCDDGHAVDERRRSDPRIVDRHPLTRRAEPCHERRPRLRPRLVDGKRLELLYESQRRQTCGATVHVGRPQDPKVEFADGHDGNGHIVWGRCGERAVLLPGNEDRRVSECGHCGPMSSVVSETAARSSSESTASALARELAGQNSAAAIVRGLRPRGVSSATGLPLTVMRRRSPAWTLRSIWLTWFRRSRAGTSAIPDP